MSVGLIGLGNMGTAIGNLIANNGHEVLGWEFNEAIVGEINTNHLNSRYLSGIELHSNLSATTEISRVVQSCEVVFVAIPSIFIAPTLSPIKNQVRESTVLVNMAKGIDGESGLTAYQTMSCLFPNNQVVMLSGPSIANEFARRLPTVVVLAGKQTEDLLKVAKLLDNGYFRTRFSNDAVGVELGGILKNIYSIGLGLFDGKDIKSVNFRSVYLTIAMEEIAKIGVAMGAGVEEFLYLSGMGDLLATAMSEHSHNRRLGVYLAQGLTLEEVKDKMGVLPEGYNTLKIILYVAEKLHVSVPLAKGLWDVIHGRFEAERFIYAFIHDFVD